METYNEQYYHNSCGPVPYEEPEHWTEFFGIVADHIIADFAPKTVLDAGCAMGYLVTALRDRGVEAYGIDISRYAISKVREDIKPFCVVGSLTDELPSKLPKRFDLVTNIEVLEHLYAEDAVKAVHTLCGATDRVLFSSTPDDFTEATHVNVQQREYWARLFAQCGFFDDISYRPTYITSHAVCYRRQPDILRQVEDYERSIRLRDAETVKQTESWNAVINDKEQYILNQSAMIADLKRSKGALEQNKAELEQEKAEAEIAIAALTKRSNELETQCDNTAAKSEEIAVELKSTQFELKREVSEHERTTLVLKHTQSELDELAEKMDSLQALHSATSQQKADLERRLAAVQASYDAISNAFFWKITKPARVFLDAIKKPLRKVPLFRLIGKGLHCWRANGWKYTWQKVITRRKHICASKNACVGDTRTISEDIKFSILVPLYNTDSVALREMIQSVMKQTYQNWELCLGDGSDAAHSNVKQICKEYTEKDDRIKYKQLEKNEGISLNTNRCAEMASGDYLALLDHDDVLARHALMENAYAIMQTDADVLYSDEDHLTADGRHINPFFKPDWSPDLLYSQMYICHFLVFRKSLFTDVAGFRKAFDGSQDYDLMLRVAKKTDKICHIPEILYSWRESPSSTAANSDAKPYAHEAGLRALDEALKAKYGANAHAEETEYTFVYNPRFPLEKDILISIIIPMKDKWEMTEDCIKSILTKSTYQCFEIILLNNRSEEVETKEWLERIGAYDARIRVVDADMEFNWSKLNNFGMSQAAGEVYVFLNNDTLVISEDWLQRLAENALRPDIGVVGGLLLYPDDTIQHAGVVVGMGGWADHVFKGQPPIHYGAPYVSPMVSRNVLAVTGACMAVSRATIKKIGAFDERFIICGSDVELGIRADSAGLFNRYDAMVRLYHLESKSRDTYIPQVDFERSYEIYAPYRENIDPYYNINLDKECTKPTERLATMGMINFKNFLKRCPLTNNICKAIRRQLMPASVYRIPEIEPIQPKKDETEGQLRLNLLIPSLNSEHVFGGIATALKMFEALRKQLQCAARLIAVDAAVSKTAIIPDGYVLNETIDVSGAKLQVIPFAERANKKLPVAANDLFMATGWWTAYTISEVIEWQTQRYGAKHPLLYMVQDYEPGFYPWSSRYLMADSTYRLSIPTYAIINSGILKEYFLSNGYTFEKTWVIEPTLNSTLSNYLPACGESIHKKKQIIVYGRPSTARNAFELLVYALRRWASQQPNAEEWNVISAGELHDDIDLGQGVVMHSVGKMSLQEYAQALLESYAGISLMVSPHPSYPPLEMAAFGVKTITNCYANKDMGSFSDNVISLQTVSDQAIAEALRKICCGYSGVGTISVDMAYLSGNDQFETISADVARELRDVTK